MEIKFPLKFALFTTSSICMPTLSWIISNDMLGGVVLAGSQTPDEQSLRAQLEQHNIPFMFYSGNQTLNESLQSWETNVGLVFAFPHLLPEIHRQQFEFGIYNLHPSALPAYRGPLPLFWQLKNGETQSAVCLHHLSDEADAGDIVVKLDIDIHPLDTGASLSGKIANAAPHAVQKLVGEVQSLHGKPAGTAQTGEGSSYLRPTEQDLIVDWAHMSAGEIHNLARATNGFTGGATIYVREIPIALLQATAVDWPNYNTPPGTLLNIGESDGLIVSTHDGAVCLDVLSCAEGVFGGFAFAQRFQLDAGMALTQVFPHPRNNPQEESPTTIRSQ